MTVESRTCLLLFIILNMLCSLKCNLLCRLSASEAASAGHETRLGIEMGPVSYVHTKRFVHELQAFTRDFGLLRRVIMQARLKVSQSTYC